MGGPPGLCSANGVGPLDGGIPTLLDETSTGEWSFETWWNSLQNRLFYVATA